ncbi:protein starmaker-like [Chenopodium quinoa]|uniref:protein starmaker-like n=1 Tax=Chenopodium quinoa TaxID=63459 RepID=UPI000B78410B|nr:protein starmaker-like [Chenopodium quinoa]
MVEYGGGDPMKGFKGSPLVLVITYLDRLNIDGRGMVWDKSVPRVGAWEQGFIDAAITADKGKDGNFGAAEDEHCKKKGKAVARKRRSKNASTNEGELEQQEKGISIGKKRTKAASSSRDKQIKDIQLNTWSQNGEEKGKLGKKRRKEKTSSDSEGEDETKKQKKKGKLGKKRRNEETSSDSEDEDEDKIKELSAKLGDKRKISKYKLDYDEVLLKKAPKEKRDDSDDNELDKETEDEDDKDGRTKSDGSQREDRPYDKYGEGKSEGEIEPDGEDEPADEVGPYEEDEPAADEGGPQKEDDANGGKRPSDKDEPDGRDGPQAGADDDLDIPRSKKPPTMSPTARRLAKIILQKKGNESLRNSVMFKFRTLSLTRGMLHDSFKKNGSISAIIMEAFGNMLNEFTCEDPKNGRHVYVMPVTYMEEAIKKLRAQGDVGDIVNRCVETIALDIAVCEILENHKRAMLFICKFHSCKSKVNGMNFYSSKCSDMDNNLDIDLNQDVEEQVIVDEAEVDVDNLSQDNEIENFQQQDIDHENEEQND